MKRIALLLLMSSLLLASLGHAQKDPNLTFETDFAEYTVRHVVFNSTFIQPEVASIYGVKRSKNESILNLSVSRRGKLGALPAEISGTVTNLMQQQKDLQFKEIEEDNATYYIAPLRVANEEVLHFNILVKPNNSDDPLRVKFSQTVYADD